MRGLLTSLIAAGLVAGCGCGEAGSTGQADGVDDPWILDGPCAACDDSNPCTMDLCNTETLECVFLPIDLDGDGHMPYDCGGDDCDDNRSDVYGGAAEVCLDGVDQDCDTVIDGPMPMTGDVRVSNSPDQSEVPSLTWTGSEFVTIWMDRLGDVLWTDTMARLDAEGVRVGEEIPIAEGYRPSIIWTGSNLAISWTGGESIGFLLLGPTGEELRRLDIPVYADRVSLVWTGSRIGVGTVFYLTSWSEPGFMILEMNGEVASDPITVATGSMQLDHGPVLAWTGSEFGLAWSGIYDWWSTEISFARISDSGEQIGEAARLTNGGRSYCPDVDWTGSEFGVAWEFSDTEDTRTMYFMRLDAIGNRLTDPERVSVYHLPIGGSWTSVEWTGSEFAVAWIEGMYQETTVAFALVDEAGRRKGDPIHVTEAMNMIYAQDLVWTGSEFGVAWTDSRDGDPACEETPEGTCQREIYFNRIGLCE